MTMMKRLLIGILVAAITPAVLSADMTTSQTDDPARALLRGTPVATDSSPRRLALVIGNGDYASSPLKNPANDASTMAETLSRLGFEVIRGLNLSQADMKRKVDEFGTRLKAGGTGLFYYAGHGMQVKGRNYLIPVDARIESEQDVEYESLDTGRVLSKMEAAGNALNIVILDACRDNPFARSFRSASHGLAHMDAPAGTLIAYATAPGSTASDGSGKNGLYTGELVRFMEKPGLKLEDVFKRVRIQVGKGTNNHQVPWESSSLVGDFYFLKEGAGESVADLPNVSLTEVEKPETLEGEWKRTGKRSFTMRIRGDKAEITDAGLNRRLPGTVIMKHIRFADGYWTADRARIAENGTIKEWGTVRLEIKGGLLLEHLAFKQDVTLTYERVK